MSPRTVVLTGVCGGLGRVVLRQLLEIEDLEVVGIDRRNWVLDRPPRFRFERVDLRRSQAEDVFRVARPWGIIHLAFVSDQGVSRAKRHEVNVVGTQKVLEWAARYDARRVVVLSRAAVYGARPDNPSLITEDMPLMLGASYTELSDLVEFDHMCRSWMWEHREVEMNLLRPVHLVGPNVREGMLYRYLVRDPVPTALGFNPLIQLIHEEDVALAIVMAIQASTRGIYNLPGPGQVPLSVLLHALGRRRVPVPHPALAAWDRLAFDLGLSKLPPHAIDFLKYPCLVDGEKIRRELGYAPRFDLGQTIRAIPTRTRSIVA